MAQRIGVCSYCGEFYCIACAESQDPQEFCSFECGNRIDEEPVGGTMDLRQKRSWEDMVE